MSRKMNLINPLVNISFYKFLNNKYISICFINDITNENITNIHDIKFIDNKNVKIEAENNNNEIILININKEASGYRANRNEFKQSFNDLSIYEDAYDKIYNIGIMEFYIRHNFIDESCEVILYENTYYMKTKDINKENYYISIDLPKYEEKLESNIDKWIFLLKDIDKFDSIYDKEDVFKYAINLFNKENLNEDEHEKYKIQLKEYIDCKNEMILSLVKSYSENMTDNIYEGCIDTIKTMVNEREMSINKVSEIFKIPQEIIMYEAKGGIKCSL